MPLVRRLPPVGASSVHLRFLCPSCPVPHTSDRLPLLLLLHLRVAEPPSKQLPSRCHFNGYARLLPSLSHGVAPHDHPSLHHCYSFIPPPASPLATDQAIQPASLLVPPAQHRPPSIPSPLYVLSPDAEHRPTPPAVSRRTARRAAVHRIFIISGQPPRHQLHFTSVPQPLLMPPMDASSQHRRSGALLPLRASPTAVLLRCIFFSARLQTAVTAPPSSSSCRATTSVACACRTTSSSSLPDRRC